MSTTNTSAADAFNQRARERREKAIPVKLGDMITIADGEYKGEFFTINADLLYPEECEDVCYEEAPARIETIVTRHADCRECGFTASTDRKGDEDGEREALDFKVWNHEHVTGHRIDVRTEVERG